MRVTIIKEGGQVYVDGLSFHDLNLQQLPATISAVQWYGTFGEIEFESQETETGMTKPANQKITDFAPFQFAVDAWNVAKAAYDSAQPITNTGATTQPPPASTTPLLFLERFTDAEQLAVVTATMQVPQVKLWYDKLIVATEVVFADPRVAAGLDFMVASGLLTQARSEEILPLSVRTTSMPQV